MNEIPLRPDELRANSQIERSKQSDSLLKRGAKTAVGIGKTALGVGLGSKIIPFLNKYIPDDIAEKAINKLAPKIGSFLNRGKEAGLDLKEGLDFVREKFENSNENPKSGKNVIQQYSDELHEFLNNEIKKGKKPLEAGALAQINPKFQKIISKLEKDHKAPFSSILQSTYGNTEQSNMSKEEALNRYNKQKQPGLRDQLMQDFESQYGQQQKQQPQQQAGQGQQALMSILQKIDQRLGG